MDALSPQEIREKIIQGVLVFEKAMVAYLEGCHKGEFMRGTMRDVQDVISEGDTHVDPTLTLPTPPSTDCVTQGHGTAGIPECEECRAWWNDFEQTVDELLLKCNVHKCIPKNKKTHVAQGTSKTYPTGPKGCLDEDGDCLARFP